MDKRSFFCMVGVMLAVMFPNVALAEEVKGETKPSEKNQTTTPASQKDEEEEEEEESSAIGSAKPAEANQTTNAAGTVTPAAKTPDTPASVPTLKKPEAPKKPTAPQYVYITEADGWQALGSWNATSQSFRAPSSKVKAISLRPAVINNLLPQGALVVEIRDMRLDKIYLQGTIDPSVLRREFYWQPVKLSYVAPLKVGEAYLLVFRSTNTRGDREWILNTVYTDVYPYGTHYGISGPDGEDVFFSMSFQDGALLHVGPRDNNTSKKVPINSGRVPAGVNESTERPVEVDCFGRLPLGELVTSKRSIPGKKK